MRRFWFGISTSVGIGLAVILFTASPVSAQAGKVTGQVTDVATGAPIAGALVTIEGTGLGVLTEANGRYFFVTVRPGTYSIVAQVIGYATERRENIEVSIDVTRQIDFQLSTEALALGEVVVTADRVPLVPRGQTGSVDMVTRAEIDALPVTDIMGVLALQQGFLQIPEDNTNVVSFAQQRQGVTSLSIRGGRGSETLVMMDGVPINNFVLGGPAFDVTNKAIQQVATFRGQMDAQYGNALSGVVSYATPEGSRDLRGDVEFRTSAAGAALGSDYDDTRAFDMMEGFVSGPVPGTNDRVRFYVAGRQRTSATALEFDQDIFNPTTPAGEFDSPLALDVIPGWRQFGFNDIRDGFAKLTFYASPSAKLNLSYIGYERENKPFDFNWMLAVNPLDYMSTQRDSAYYLARPGLLRYNDMIPATVRLNRNMVIARWDQTVNRTAYKVTGSVMNQSRETCNVISGVCLENSFEDINFTDVFRAPGPAAYFNTPTAGTDKFWGGEDLTTYTGRFDVQSQLSDHHNLSAGVLFQYHDLVYDEWSNEGTNDVILQRQNYVANPWDGAFYLQDQIEYDFITLKLGARFDYGRATGLFFANPVDPTNGTTALDVCRNPEQWQNVTLREVDENGDRVVTQASADPSWTITSCGDVATRTEAARIAASDDFEEAKARTQFSPRIGVSFPVTEESNLFFNFGRYSQNPILRNNYQNTGIGTPLEGTASGPALFGSQYSVPFLGNPHLLTEQSTMWEIGYNQEFDNTYALTAAIFNKSQTGLTGIARVGTGLFQVQDPGVTYGSSTPSYSILINNDFATSRGLEMSFRRRVRDNWGFDVNYGFSQCKTNSTDPQREFERQTSEGDEGIRGEVLCDIDQPHRFTGVLRLAAGRDAPDIPFGDFLTRTSAALIYTTVSGLPYTPTRSITGTGVINESPRNSGRAPSTGSVNLQLRKDFGISNVNYGVFATVDNLLARRNCIQVYATTGTCDSGAADQENRRSGNFVNNPSSTAFDRPQFIGTRRAITAGMRISF